MNETKELRAIMNDSKWELIVEVEAAAAQLGNLPSVIQNMMENFGLDAYKLTEGNKYDIVNRSAMITDTLWLVVQVIQTASEAISAAVNKAAASK